MVLWFYFRYLIILLSYKIIIMSSACESITLSLFSKNSWFTYTLSLITFTSTMLKKQSRLSNTKLYNLLQIIIDPKIITTIILYVCTCVSGSRRSTWPTKSGRSSTLGTCKIWRHSHLPQNWLGSKCSFTYSKSNGKFIGRSVKRTIIAYMDHSTRVLHHTNIYLSK